MSVSVVLPGVTIASDGSQYALKNLVGLTDSVDPRLLNEAREFGHGDFEQDDVFQAARYITVEGEFHPADDVEKFTGGDVLKALHGQSFELYAVAPDGVRRVQVVLASRVEWDANVGPGVVPFEFTVKADDPRVYGPAQVGSTGVPTAGVGVADPIIDPFSEGAPGNLGRVAIVNTGTAPSEPRVRVTGGLSGGFELRHIEVGRVIRVTREIFDGSFIDIDMGSGAVWIDDQSPVPASDVPVSEWVSVAPGATATLQFTPLGVVTGTPTMTVEWAVASW